MISSQMNDIAGIYLRLSNEDERVGESGSISNQREILIKYAKDNGIRVAEEYVDDGFSGTSFDRPSFKRMLEDINKNKINVVITKDMSRLGREHIETCFYIEKFFPENNIRYISVLDGLDTAIDNGISDITPFKAVINDMYAKDISKKIRSVKKSRAEAGKYMGTYAPYGYIKDPNDKNKLIIDEEIAPIIKKIFELGARGIAPLQISYKLTEENVPTPSVAVGNNHSRTSITQNSWKHVVIRRMLQNELYLGHLLLGKTKKLNYKSKKIILTDPRDWIRNENMHEAIIDQETFDRANEHIKRRSKVRTKTHEWLLKGILQCKDCGKKIGITVDTKNHKTVYTRCPTYANSPKSKLCTSHMNNLEKLTEVIIQQIKNRCLKYINENEIRKIANMQDQKQIEKENKVKELQLLRNQIEIFNKRIDKIYDDKLNEILNESDFQRLYKSYIDQRLNVEKKIVTIEVNSNKKNDTFDKDEIIKDFIIMKEITSSMLTKLVSKIEISQDKEIYIHYNIKELN